jgi:tetratricopeptide (TPR) repeat protein
MMGGKTRTLSVVVLCAFASSWLARPAALAGEREALLAQANDTGTREKERKRLQEWINSMTKKSPQQTSPAGPAPTTPSGPGDSDLNKRTQEFLVAVPRDAGALTIDGQELSIKNVEELRRPEFERPALFMPKGTHLVGFHADASLQDAAPARRPSPVTKDRFFSEEYAAIRDPFLDGEGRVSIRKLAPALWAAKENFDSPILPHLLGNYYFSQGKYEVAERKYWQAIRVNPCFALSHLNLACIYAKHPDQLKPREGVDFARRAAEELHWAEHFNVGDAFGIRTAVADLRQEMKLAPLVNPPALRLQDYASAQAMDDADRRVVGVLDAAMKYLPSNVERAKLLNNKAVYFKSRNKNDLALAAYMEAIRALGDSVKDADAGKVVDSILTNAGNLCQSQWQGGREEFDIYKEYIQRP